MTRSFSCAFRWLLAVCLAVSPAPAMAEELPVLRRSYADAPAVPAAFENGAFLPASGETISLLGGTNTSDQDRHGCFEALLRSAWPDMPLSVRNLAWPGDTVHHQARPRYFYTQQGDTQPGSLPDHREKTRAGTIVIEFGKLESLDPQSTPETFQAACEILLTDLQPLTRRIVLVAPSPFFPTGPAAADCDARNERLAAYVSVLKTLADEHDCLWVDLFHAWRDDPQPAWSDNGVHLNQEGHLAAAREMARQLNFPLSEAQLEEAPGSPALLELQAAILAKNHLWKQYYQPTNWAFLFGDRQHVPASRDPVQRDERWLVRELDSIPALLREADAALLRLTSSSAASSDGQ